MQITLEKLADMCCTASKVLRKEVIILKRSALDKLITWKASSDRKPLILKGARQVGKTWLMHEFGTTLIIFNEIQECSLEPV